MLAVGSSAVQPALRGRSVSVSAGTTTPRSGAATELRTSATWRSCSDVSSSRVWSDAEGLRPGPPRHRLQGQWELHSKAAPRRRDARTSPEAPALLRASTSALCGAAPRTSTRSSVWAKVADSSHVAYNNDVTIGRADTERGLRSGVRSGGDRALRRRSVDGPDDLQRRLLEREPKRFDMQRRPIPISKLDFTPWRARAG